MSSILKNVLTLVVDSFSLSLSMIEQKSERLPDTQILPLCLGGLCAQCRHVTKIPCLAFPPLPLSSFQSAHFLQFFFQCLSARAGNCQKNKYVHPEKSHSFTKTTLNLSQLLPPSWLSPSQIRSSCIFHPSGCGLMWLATWLGLDCGAFSWGRFLLLKEASSSCSATADLLALSHIGKLVGSTYLRWASWESGKTLLCQHPHGSLLSLFAGATEREKREEAGDGRILRWLEFGRVCLVRWAGKHVIEVLQDRKQVKHRGN